MIAGLNSPPVESPGQESDNDSLPGQGYTSSHASSDDEQSAILLLDDSTSSSHANQRRQARHPNDARPTHSDPTAEDPGNIALSLILRPANDHGVPATHGRSSRWNLFNALGMHGRRTTCATYPIPFCLRWLHRTQYGLGRRSIQTVGANAYIPHSHAPDCAADPANWRTSCHSASLMRDASRKVADSCSNAAPRIFETAAAGIRRGLIKLRSQCPSTQNFLRGYRPAPRLG